MRALAALSLVACIGCGASDGLVVVTVQTSDFTVQKLSRSLHVLASAAGRDASTAFTRSPNSLSFPESFAIQTPADYDGTISVQVTAVDDFGRALATAAGTVDAHPSEKATITLQLVGLPGTIVDGGTGDSGFGLDAVFIPFDAGFDAGGNGAGPSERCDATIPCAPGLNCAGDGAGPLHCLYPCVNGGDCPAQTQCTIPQHVVGSGGYACLYVSNSDAAARQAGQSCTQTSDHCVADYICGAATCDAQCDGPGGACVTGTCRVLPDPTRSSLVIAYTCQP
jgi:hypothetical protein